MVIDGTRPFVENDFYTDKRKAVSLIEEDVLTIDNPTPEEATGLVVRYVSYKALTPAKGENPAEAFSKVVEDDKRNYVPLKRWLVTFTGLVRKVQGANDTLAKRLNELISLVPDIGPAVSVLPARKFVESRRGSAKG